MKQLYASAEKNSKYVSGAHRLPALLGLGRVDGLPKEPLLGFTRECRVCTEAGAEGGAEAGPRCFAGRAKKLLLPKVVGARGISSGGSVRQGEGD